MVLLCRTLIWQPDIRVPSADERRSPVPSYMYVIREVLGSTSSTSPSSAEELISEFVTAVSS